MKSIIDALETHLRKNQILTRCHIEAFGATFQLPETLPYINIVPRSKNRSRIPTIGMTNQIYDTSPEIELHVWEASAEDLKDAFGKTEALAEKVLTALSAISAATLGLLTFEFGIEDYVQDFYESYFYYEAVILLAGRKEETHP